MLLNPNSLPWLKKALHDLFPSSSPVNMLFTPNSVCFNHNQSLEYILVLSSVPLQRLFSLPRHSLWSFNFTCLIPNSCFRSRLQHNFPRGTFPWQMVKEVPFLCAPISLCTFPVTDFSIYAAEARTLSQILPQIYKYSYLPLYYKSS